MMRTKERSQNQEEKEAEKADRNMFKKGCTELSLALCQFRMKGWFINADMDFCMVVFQMWGDNRE